VGSPNLFNLLNVHRQLFGQAPSADRQIIPAA
jgi:hypothetical protein